MTPRLVTAPVEEPVSLPELKQHIVNAADTEDADLQLKLSAASSWIAAELGRPLVTSTWDLYFEAWPVSGDFAPLLGNTQSITSVKYAVGGGSTLTLDSSVYRLARAYSATDGNDSDSGTGRLYLAYGKAWPGDALEVADPIVVRLVAGWKGTAEVPTPIKQAILMSASHWYKNRDAVIAGRGEVSDELKFGVERLIAPYKEWRWR